MLSWAKPMRVLAPASGDGVGEGLNSIEQVYEADVDWTKMSPATTATTATTATPMIAAR
jgi:hypothetical protein